MRGIAILSLLLGAIATAPTVGAIDITRYTIVGAGYAQLQPGNMQFLEVSVEAFQGNLATGTIFREHLLPPVPAAVQEWRREGSTWCFVGLTGPLYRKVVIFDTGDGETSFDGFYSYGLAAYVLRCSGPLPTEPSVRLTFGDFKVTEGPI